MKNKFVTDHSFFVVHANICFFRSWDRICVVLKGSQVLFYKDQKTYRTRPEETFRSELPVDLIGGTAEVAADYTKKKHVFRLRLAFDVCY